MIFNAILDRINRAGRNDERLHLENEMAQALISSPLYPMLARLAAKELESTWKDKAKPQGEGSSNSGPESAQKQGSRSETTGSPTAPSATTGAFAGTIQKLVIDAESEQALAAAHATIHLSKRKKRSRHISPAKPQRAPKLRAVRTPGSFQC